MSGTRWWWPVAACAALVLAASPPATAPLEAQRPRGTTRAPRPQPGRGVRAVRTEYANVLLQAGRYREAAGEFRRLLQAAPDDWSLRLGLARALAWGDRPREAEVELRRLAARRPRDEGVDSLLRSVRESYEPSSREAAAWVAERPEHLPYRMSLARALVRERRPREALAQYDTLLRWQPSAPVYLERGRVLAGQRDWAGAEQDLRASLALAPSVDAWVLLGDVHRWRGDYEAARAAYDSASALRPGDRAVARAMGDLRREERPPIALAPMPVDDPGWRLTGQSVEDNTGFSYFTAGARRGMDVNWGAVASVGGEYRSLGERDDGGRFVRRVNGYAADMGLSRTFAYGRIGGRGGIAMHEAVDPVPYGSASATAWYGAWEATVQVDAAPAYATLLTMATVLPSDVDAQRPLSATSATATLAGALGAADVAVSGQRTRLGDENVRSTVQAFARWGLAPRWHAIYSGSVIRFAERSVAYWDPLSYMAHAAGVELASRRPRGLSYALRVLPGVARAEEMVRSRDLEELGVETRWVPQLSGGGEVSWRGVRWELAAGVAYGRGRSGDYERVDSNVQVRLLP